MSYICERCGNSYKQKKNLKRHLKSNIICKPILNDLNREQYLKKISDPNYIFEQPKAPKYASNIFNDTKVHRLSVSCVGNERKSYLLCLSSYKMKSYDTHWTHGIHDFITEQFYNTFNSSINVTPGCEFVQVLWEQDLMLLLTKQQVLSKLLYPFIEVMTFVNYKFKNLIEKYKLNQDDMEGTEWEDILYNKFFNKHKKPIHDLKVKYFDDSISVYKGEDCKCVVETDSNIIKIQENVKTELN